VRQLADLYALEFGQTWKREHADLHFAPALSRAGEGGAGSSGLVHEATLTDFADLRGFEVHVCSSMTMVEAAVPAFPVQGLADVLCSASAFEPSADSTPTRSG